jgi:hypothetical protein
VNGICGCGLPARCCQPAVAGGFIYADLWGELSTHLALQSLFTQSSPVREPLLQVFPFPSTLGEVTLHPLSQAYLFVHSSCGKWVFLPLLWSFPPTATFTGFPAPDYWAVLLLLPAAVFVHSSRGKWVFPPLLWSFPPSTTLTSFLTPGCWACAAAPAFSSQLVYLQFTWEVGLPPPLLWSFLPTTIFTSFLTPGCWACATTPTLSSRFVRDFPSPPLQRSGYPTLFAMCLFRCYCLLFSFFYSCVGVGLSRGLMLIWPRIVCRNTISHLAHLVVHVFPNHLGTCQQHGEPSWFFI